MGQDERDIARMSAEERRLLLARLLRERGTAPVPAAGGAAIGPALVPVARDCDLPLSFAQERLWFFEQFESGTAAYNMSMTLRLQGSLHRALLEQALQHVVDRHESLRTRFASSEGRPVQRVSKSVQVNIEAIQVPAGGAAERYTLAQAEMARVARQPFDLSSDTLIRVYIAQLGLDEHLLTLIVHHIVADGWSVGLLVREWGTCYSALAERRMPVLPPLPVQYADYAVWQRQALDGETLERDLAYWRQRLAQTPLSIDLPLDRPRPKRQVFDSAECQAFLPAATVAAVRELSRTAETTPFMTLLAAFHVLVHRLTGEAHVAVGFPIADRTRREVEGLIGMFVNTLVLSLEVSSAQTFRETLASIRQAALEAYGHQGLSFEKLVEHLRPTRDLSRTPVFQLLFNMIPPASSALKGWSGLEVTVEGAPDLASHFDLTLYVREASPALDLLLVYNRALFSEPRMTEMLGQYMHLLSQAVASPDVPVGTHSLVTSAARAVLPDPSAGLAAEPQANLFAAFARHVVREPGKTAVVSEGEHYTYEDVDRRSGRLAAALRSAGVSPGDVVAVRAERVPALVWTLLGVLKAGASFAILDDSQPPDRLVATLDASSAKAWVNVAPEHPPTGALHTALARLPLGEVAADRSDPDTPEPFGGPEPSGDSLAYVTCTSGTTGGLKAIAGTHGPVVHFIDWQRRTFGLAEGDRFVLLSGLAHDPLLRDVFTPLSIGASLLVPPGSIMLEPEALTRLLCQERVSVVHLTPALGEVLAQAGPLSEPGHVRYFFFGGDLLSRSLVARLRENWSAAACVNFYGATETPQAMAWTSVDDEAGGPRPALDAVPLGRGIDGVQVLVVNQQGVLAGVGELGEIWIRTPYLSLGYANDPRLTACRFLKNPFHEGGEDFVYRTGDLARYRPDGSVEFAGRVDSQVKIRGHRVELGEIEARLGEHPAVAQAVVVASGDSPGQRRLVAYLVGRSGETLNAEEIATYLGTMVPPYMVPSAFVSLPAIPLTPNGKIDRRALPLPDQSGGLARDHVPPRTPTETLVCGIWRDVLGVPSIGVHDNFFEVGGHSLLATQVTSRLRRACGVEIPVRAVFESPTVALLSRLVDAACAAASGGRALRPAARDGRRARLDETGAPVLQKSSSAGERS